MALLIFGAVAIPLEFEVVCLPSRAPFSSFRRYFCAVCLNQTLYARTTTKQMGDMLFWGEEFDLNNLPDISVVTINLYREGDVRAKNRGKKDRCPQNVLIAYVSIPVSDILGRCELEQWYETRPPPLAAAASSALGKRGNVDLPLIRVKARYQSVDVLPLACYQSLREVGLPYRSIALVPFPSLREREVA